MRPSRRGVLGGAAAAAIATRAAADPVAVSDASGRLLVPPAAVRRVFPAGPPAAILLHALAPDLLLGWTNARGAAEREFLPPETRDLPAVGRLTGRGNTANLETVLALRPDLIVDVGATDATYVSLADRVSAQTGIPYALLDGRLDRTADAVRRLGRLLRREAAGEQLAGFADSTIARARTRALGAPGPSPRVYFARGPRGIETAAGGSINAESLAVLGAVNVAGGVAGNLVNVSVEQILAWAPDVVVATDATFVEAARRDPAWSTVPAVRTGRIHTAPALPFGTIDSPPSINRLAGLPWLGAILYPTVFPDPAGEMRDIYRTIYHREPDAAQLRTLLSGHP